MIFWLQLYITHVLNPVYFLGSIPLYTLSDGGGGQNQYWTSKEGGVGEKQMNADNGGGGVKKMRTSYVAGP